MACIESSKATDGDSVAKGQKSLKHRGTEETEEDGNDRNRDLEFNGHTSKKVSKIHSAFLCFLCASVFQSAEFLKYFKACYFGFST